MASLLKRFIAAFTTRFGAALVSVLVTVLVANQLTVDKAGEFFLFLTITTLTGMLSTAGLPNLIIKLFGSNYEKNVDQEIVAEATTQTTRFAVRHVLKISITISLVITFVTISCSHVFYVDPLRLATILFAALATPVFAMNHLHTDILIGQRRPNVAVFWRNCLPFAPIFLALSIFNVGSIQLLNLLYVLGLIVSTAGAYVSCSIDSFKRGRLDHSEREATIKVATAMWTTTAASLLITWSGQLILGALSTSNEVALYSVAHRISLVGGLLLTAVSFVVAPIFAREYKKGRYTEVWNLYLFSCASLGFVGLIFFSIVYFFCAPILSVFGDSYQSAELPTKILALSQFINIASGTVGYLLNMTGAERALKVSVCIAALTALILSGVLAPLLGAVGAAVATCISLSTQNMLCIIYARKKFRSMRQPPN